MNPSTKQTESCCKEKMNVVVKKDIKEKYVNVHVIFRNEFKAYI